MLRLQEGRDSARIDVVFDTYRKLSIKGMERERRCSDTANQFKNISPGHRVQQWRRFLSSSTNKTSLIEFINKEWKEPSYRQKLNGKILFTTCGSTCILLTEEAWENVEELECTHEEADTRLFLHAEHVSKSGGYKAIIIAAEDTDVFVLALALSSSISVPLFQRSGTQNRQTFTNISMVSHALGKDVCNALPALYSFTGCDSVSSFTGKGKLCCLKIVRRETEYQEMFGQLGQEWDVSEELCGQIEKFTCLMYDSKCSTTSINSCRFKLFCSRRGAMESSQLPPCQDCLLQHLKRANYQTAIWRRSLEPKPNIPDPVNMGWHIEEGTLEPLWMTGPPAPTAVLQLLSCKCVRSCKEDECQCAKSGLKCTELSRLANCANWKAEAVTEKYILMRKLMKKIMGTEYNI